MSDDTMAIAAAGLDAWRRGDFDTLERILDPAVEWHAFERGEWDCNNRDDVMQTLRDRHAEGFAAGELELRDGGDDTVIVVSHPREIGGPDWPEETATVMHFRDGLVVLMHDYNADDVPQEGR